MPNRRTPRSAVLVVILDSTISTDSAQEKAYWLTLFSPNPRKSSPNSGGSGWLAFPKYSLPSTGTAQRPTVESRYFCSVTSISAIAV